MDLTGQLLIAMPGMGDPRFEHSVVYICSHGEDGAMGLIVNKPADLRISALLTQLDIPCKIPVVNDTPVRFGGPVETARGFVLHSTDYDANLHSMNVDAAFSMTATLDILEDMANGAGPAQRLLMLGYSGWGPGQLESEIGENGWLTVQADPALVFDIADDRKWEAALKLLGIDPLTLSASAGHA
ncbi:YqgE/AlgH family protein [Ruegeria sp. 2205SS24-7]|uniref:YqgE/AlgH family protein n=1 Tax=Ruegeria discodermiae TaxID=3064389 RepID=UPI0027415603|nr:YqgE/AlgH family protein [Ruegeria sp. 2205SS24-7]MDP5217499.1 YqgE/AlgH family protein [Ruegeria sp. 2205SS24-7]